MQKKNIIKGAAKFINEHSDAILKKVKQKFKKEYEKGNITKEEFDLINNAKDLKMICDFE